MANQIVIFQMSNQAYGLDIHDISEIIRMRKITSIPNTAEHMVGVADLRGSFYSVLDGRLLLGLEKAEDISDSKIIVFSEGKVGMVVDHVTEIVRVEDSEQKAVEGMSGLEDVAYIDYLVERDNQIVSVLKLKALMDSQKAQRNEEIA